MSAHAEPARDAPSGETERAAAWKPLEVSVEIVRRLRGEVLRPGQPPEQLVFDADDAPETLHAAVILGGTVVAVATVIRQECPTMSAPSAWRLRGMATSASMRGRGLGAALLSHCEEHARAHGGALLWCNARVGARAFYERAGMEVAGERFDIPPIGEHFLMTKALQASGAGAGTC